MCDTIKKMKHLSSTTSKNVVQNESSNLLCQKQSIDIKKGSTLKINTNEDVQRAIEGLKDIPDEELQEFFDDEDFFKGLDVADVWEGDQEGNREGGQKVIYVKEREQKCPSRDKHCHDHKEAYNHETSKHEEKKQEEVGCDPSKSTKDIERDKIRTKRDSENKLLAEKEKAIKHLLDSDNVVPPGTEVEAIQSITEKQNLERAQMHIRRSRERRRSVERQRGSSLRHRSSDKVRLSSPQRRTPLILSSERHRSSLKILSEKHWSPYTISPEKSTSPLRFNCDHRSPFIFSPEQRQSPVRRLSWERRTSTERRWSAEKYRRRINVHERSRSRSHDQQRSRSIERFRRKSSRSPISGRYSPRRRSRSRSRSIERHTRKRSPFINELVRQLRTEAMITSHMNTRYTHSQSIDGVSPLLNTAMCQQEAEPRFSISLTPYTHQPTLSSSLSSDIPMTGNCSSAPAVYNQTNKNSIQATHRPPLLPVLVPSPQPVSAPITMDNVPMTYNSSHGIPPRQSPTHNSEFSNRSTKIISQSYKEHRTTTAYNGYCVVKEKQLKTLEPSTISDTKQFDKTSLSSLLEASVSAKDSPAVPVLYPGFKPEILRHCEHALRELPMKDPRLKMKGRFFYDPQKENVQNESLLHSSNSILLKTRMNKVYWEEDEEQNLSSVKQNVQTRQKICQTDEIETDTKFVQASVTMVDFEIQVYPEDLQEVGKDEKRPIMDRLDCNVRDTFSYTPKYRESDDLGWSLSKSQKKVWNRTVSPSKRSDDCEHRLDSVSSLDRNSRNVKLGSPMRSRDSFSSRKESVRDHCIREKYAPQYRHSLNVCDEYHENISDCSDDEILMMSEVSDEEFEEEHTFQTETDWRESEKLVKGRSRINQSVQSMRSEGSKCLVTTHQASVQSHLGTTQPISRNTYQYVALESGDAFICDCCKMGHFIVTCTEFRAMDGVQRRQLVEDKQLCYNCLGRHSVRACRSTKVCKMCQGKHHTMLHSYSIQGTT